MLTGPDRLAKLAAAKELLAARQVAAIDELVRLAGEDPDEVTATAFRAIAARLRGVDVVERLFFDPATDPRLCRLLVSNYNSDLVPDADDVRFLTRALGAYLDRSLPWLATLRHDLWDNGAYLILVGLSGATPSDLATRREALLPLLQRLTGEDGDLADEARTLLSALAPS